MCPSPCSLTFSLSRHNIDNGTRQQRKKNILPTRVQEQKHQHQHTIEFCCCTGFVIANAVSRHRFRGAGTVVPGEK